MIHLPEIPYHLLEGRTVFLRLDLNVPLKNKKVQSDARIEAALATIQRLQEAGAIIAIASHLGRPQGKVNAEESLEPVGVRLCELLDQDIVLAGDCIGDGVKSLLQSLRPSQLLLLENLRFHAGEEKNDIEFAKALAAPFDIYINDAFGASHRSHASIVGMVKYTKQAYAGPLLQREVKALAALYTQPRRPFVAIVGGAKVSDKLGVLQALLQKVDVLCIGGAMAYTFLKAAGIAIGKSRFESGLLATSEEIIQRARARGVRLLLPQDHVAAESFDEKAPAQVIHQSSLPDNWMGLDIGPLTQKTFAQAIEQAQMVFWNGPMGVFEWPAYATGTFAVAQAVAKNQGYTVVGGGDSVAAIEAAKVVEQISHVSTGGGASLELIQYQTLPGLEAIARHGEQRDLGQSSNDNHGDF